MKPEGGEFESALYDEFLRNNESRSFRCITQPIVHIRGLTAGGMGFAASRGSTGVGGGGGGGGVVPGAQRSLVGLEGQERGLTVMWESWILIRF